MSSTLAGNLTLLGSIANLIVVEGAKRHGIRITFVEYLKVGLPSRSPPRRRDLVAVPVNMPRPVRPDCSLFERTRGLLADASYDEHRCAGA